MVNRPPVTSCENSFGFVTASVPIMQFFIALFPSVPPPACSSDGCCGDVCWPGGSFPVCCARKERRRHGGRSWGGGWLRFCRISAPTRCQASGRSRHCRGKTRTQTSQQLWRIRIRRQNEYTYLNIIFIKINFIQTQLDQYNF